MKNKCFWLFIVALAIVSLLAGSFGCAQATTTSTSTATSTSAKVYSAKFICDFPPVSDDWTKFYVPLLDEMEQASGGRLKIERYPGGSLYRDSETVDVLPKGLVQIAAINQSFWKGTIPELNVMDMGGYFESTEHYYRWRDQFQTDYVDKQYLQPHNTKLLFTEMKGMYQQVGLTVDTKSLKDMKGLKVQVFGKDMAGIPQCIGCSAVSLNIGDVSQSLERQLVNGVCSSINIWLGFGWQNNMKSVWESPLLLSHTYCVMNLEWFKSLPADLQDIITTKAMKYQQISRSNLLVKNDADISMLKGMGIHYWSSTPEEANKFRECYKVYIKDYLIKESIGEKTFNLYLDWVQKTK